MSITCLIDEMETKVREEIRTMDETNAEGVGLDPRAAYKLYVDRECIVVSKSEDRTLQYYGGFEYVDRSSRTEIGPYVVYLSDADRVQECIDCHYRHSDDVESPEA